MKQLDKINTTLFLTPDEYVRSGLTKFFKETLGVSNVHKMEILINDGPEPRVAIELEYFKASETSCVTDKVSEQRFMERAAQINERMKEKPADTSSFVVKREKSANPPKQANFYYYDDQAEKDPRTLQTGMEITLQQLGIESEIVRDCDAGKTTVYVRRKELV